VCEKSELQTVIFCISSFFLRATHRVPRALPSTHRRLPRPNRPRRRSENPSPRHFRARAGPRAAPRAALRAAAAAARRASDSREGRWRRTTPSATRWWGAPRSACAAEAISLKMSSKMFSEMFSKMSCRHALTAARKSSGRRAQHRSTRHSACCAWRSMTVMRGLEVELLLDAEQLLMLTDSGVETMFREAIRRRGCRRRLPKSTCAHTSKCARAQDRRWQSAWLGGSAHNL
jgi:hypothetical protein